MRRQLFTVITPFVRGARLGAYVTGATLALSLLGAVMILVAQPGSSEASMVATDAPSVPYERATKHDAIPIDRALLAAAERTHPAKVGDLLLQLSREAAVAVQTPEPPAPPPVATAAAASAPVAPAVPAAPPLVIAGDPLREALAVYFPEQVEFAYSVVMCESSGNARAVSRSGYYGLWQFDVATWQSVGGAGLPSNASVEEQMARARQLYDRRGWSPWGCA